MRLYALCDQDMLDANNISLVSFIEIAKKNSAEIIQYRNKNGSLELIKEKLLSIKKLSNALLIVNDKYELVQYCDGVHMGQEDLRAVDSDIFEASKRIREYIGKDKYFGISTHNKEEILEANGMDLDYIGLGAYRDTSTKKDIATLLGDKLDSIASYSKHKVAVIGGVKMDDSFENITYHVIGSGLLR